MKEPKEYQITVTEIGIETKICGKVWAKVTDNPNDEYAYTPEIEKTVEYKDIIYEQTVKEFFIADLVRVVNNLWKK